jgi:hypothetical protein
MGAVGHLRLDDTLKTCHDEYTPEPDVELLESEWCAKGAYYESGKS